jgi:hypothetical protein
VFVLHCCVLSIDRWSCIERDEAGRTGIHGEKIDSWGAARRAGLYLFGERKGGGWRLWRRPSRRAVSGQRPKATARPIAKDWPGRNLCQSDDLKRRGGDSNSRVPCGTTGFRNRRIQPLCHLSGWSGRRYTIGGGTSKRQKRAVARRWRPGWPRHGCYRRPGVRDITAVPIGVGSASSDRRV